MLVSVHTSCKTQSNVIYQIGVKLKDWLLCIVTNKLILNSRVILVKFIKVFTRKQWKLLWRHVKIHWQRIRKSSFCKRDGSWNNISIQILSDTLVLQHRNSLSWLLWSLFKVSSHGGIGKSHLHSKSSNPLWVFLILSSFYQY
jgi:hypothetical protein